MYQSIAATVARKNTENRKRPKNIFIECGMKYATRTYTYI